MITTQALTFSYGGQPVVRDCSADFRAGDITAIMGPSGCGKSTLLRLIAGLESPDAGHVVHGGGKPAFVFQDAALMPWARVIDNVALGQRLGQNPGPLTPEDALTAVGLAGTGNRYPATLSGGQRMRVSIARALCSPAKTVLFDEPFAALDEIKRFALNDLVRALTAQHGWTVVFVTHSLYEAAYIADRILVMQDGRLSGAVQPELDRSLDPDAQRASPALQTAVQSLSALLRGDTP